jgi:protein involved in polysaccharide export with SLBB domain
MRFKLIICFFLLVFTACITKLSAQSFSTSDISKIKVNQLSDQQISDAMKKMQASGLSETDALLYLKQNGMPASEADELKRRLTVIKGGAKSSPISGKSTQSAQKDTISYRRDTTVITNTPLIKRNSPIYGYDFFSNPKIKFEPNIRLATPENYILGPDDNLTIILTGLNETSVTSRITPEGNVRVPYVGLVYINGFTIAQARAQLKSKMQRFYPALGNGSTQLSVLLGTVRTIRVNINGEAINPGSYSLSSLSNVINALYLSGGPSDQGSLRNIQIIRSGKIVSAIDFYSYLQNGLLKNDIRLEDQDIIHFPIYTKRVVITGEVKRPGTYELLESETLSDLVKYAGGYSDIAYKAMAKVTQIGNKERSVKDVPADIFERYTLKNGDAVAFEAILPRFSNRVFIEGAVYHPGVFELNAGGMTLKELIAKADGLRDDAFTTSAYIKRLTPGLEKEIKSFDPGRILNGTQPDISLMREDSVVIMSGAALKDVLFVTIDGNVRSPGTFIYRNGMKVSDVIIMAGGFTVDAANQRVEVSRVLKDRSDIIATKLADNIILDVDSTLNNSGARFALEARDYINVPRLVNSRTLGNVYVRGEVLSPGDYVLLRRNETAPELLTRAGGLTPSGSLANAQIYRNGLRMNMDLTGTRAKQDPKDLIVMEGDSIIIPRESLYVQVTGAVNNPQLLSYQSRSFKYYVNAAGGETQNARLKGAFVQYADGTNQPVKHFLFFRNYPAVTPGSKITVPIKTPDQRVRLGIGEISALTSVLTGVITLVALLFK